MIPKRVPARRSETARLLVVRGEVARETLLHSHVRELGKFLERGDLLVVNRSGTVPASLRGRARRTGESLELRLASFLGPSAQLLENWNAVAFGAGDWLDPTEARGLPPRPVVGDEIVFGANLWARVTYVDPEFPRWLRVQLEGTNLVSALHEHGQPIQYSYLTRRLHVEEQQTLFAGPPVSVEPPSAAFPISWQHVLQLEHQGVEVASLTHSAGLSSTGERELDERLPFAEWFELPDATAHAIEEAKAAGRRVVALGTTVVRAIESAFVRGVVAAGSGLATERIEPSRPLRVVDALITGMHEPGTSHLELMHAFCDEPTLVAAYLEAENRGYLGHEYGDLTLLERREKGEGGVGVSRRR